MVQSKENSIKKSKVRDKNINVFVKLYAHRYKKPRVWRDAKQYQVHYFMRKKKLDQTWSFVGFF